MTISTDERVPMAITLNLNSQSAKTIALPQRVWCARIYQSIMLGNAKFSALPN
jgi:hypothetical protein